MKGIAIVAAGLVAATVSVVAPTAAEAIPIRNLQTSQHAAIFNVQATVFSPPNASCGAFYQVSIYRVSNGVRYGRRSGALNVCRGQAGRFTTGQISATFLVGRWPVTRYDVCVVAGQRVNGLRSVHAVCKRRTI